MRSLVIPASVARAVERASSGDERTAARTPGKTRDVSTIPPFATGLIGLVAVAQVALHLYVLAVTQFGVHRDEFLYFAMGQHLRFWRMDFPPLIAVLANVARAIFGDGLASVRVFPAVEGAALVLLAAAIARELGGGRFAQALASVSVLAAPLVLRASTLFQPVILDQIWWTLALFALVRVLRTGEPRWWLLVGSALGLGLLTKFSIAFVGLAMLAALLLTSDRRMLLGRWPWMAAALALAVGSASIVGQMRLGFPVVGQLGDLQETQLTHVSWLSFVLEQPLLVGVAAGAVAVAGAAALLGGRRLARYRTVGLTCVVAFLFLLALHGKSYYAGPIYPTLLAAGAVVLEHVRRPAVGATLRAATFALVIALGAVALPLGVPLLSLESTARYAARLGVGAAVKTNRGVVDRLPQDYADMVGWEEQAQALRQAYASLPPEEQREAVIIGGNYGEAGAADFYRARYGLPPVVSAAGSYWFFGPGERSGRVAIVIGATARDLQPFYGDVRSAVHILSPWSVAEERDVRVLIARRPRSTLQAVWPSLAGHH